MKKRKVDIFQVLNSISTKNSSFYDEMTEEERKGIAPLIVMRWLSGTSSARQVFFINELVNTKVFSLYKHPKLLYQLMTVCAPGHSQRYNWNKVQKKKSTSMPKTNSLVQQYFGYNSSDAENALPLLNDQDIAQCAEQLGWQPDDIKVLNKELKARNKHATTA